MRVALIFMCGLGVLAAASATIEESRLGIRQSRSGTRDAGIVIGAVAQDQGSGARASSGAGLEETVATNCPKPATHSGDAAATVQLADATH